MKRMSRACACWFGASLLAFTTGPRDACAQFPIQMVALTGQHAPGTAGDVNFGSFSVPIISATGQVAFRAHLTGADVTGGNSVGMWRGHIGGLELMARTGQPAPGTSNDTLFHELSALRLGANGDVSIAGNLVGPTVTSLNSLGMWSGGGTSGALALHVRSGAQAPGLPEGVVYHAAGNPSTMNASGDVVYFGTVRGPGVINDLNGEAMWVGKAGATAMVARTGDVAPGTANVYANFAGHRVSPAINDAGVVAFDTSLGSLIDGLFVRTHRTVELIARTGQPAPGTHYNYRTTRVPRINRQGQVAWLGTTSGPVGGGTPSASWRWSGGVTQLIAFEGIQAVGLPDGVAYGNLGAPSLGDGGHVAFTAGLRGSGVLPFFNDAALWHGTPGDLNLVARAGDVPPGISDGSQFVTFGAPLINSTGEIAFVGALNGATQSGIWATDREGILRLVLRQGAPIDVGNGNVRTIAGLQLMPMNDESPVRGPALTDDGRLAVWLSFTGGGQGLFVVTVPEPACAAPLIAAVHALLRRNRRRVDP